MTPPWCRPSSCQIIMIIITYYRLVSREKRGVRPGDHDDNHYSRENNHGSSDKDRSYGRQEQEGQGRGGKQWPKIIMSSSCLMIDFRAIIRRKHTSVDVSGDGRGRHDGGNQGHRQQPPSRKHDGHHSARSDRSPPPMKKMDEAKPPVSSGIGSG